MKKEVTSHVVKGLVVALILIVYSIAIRLLGMQLETWPGLVSMCLLIGAVLWGTIIYGNQMEHNVTFGKLFSHGFKMTAVITCLVFLFTVLSIYVIFPETLDELWEKGMDQARKNPNFTEPDENAMAVGRKVMTAFVLATALLGTLIVGMIGALIGAAAAKKRPRAEFENA